jgi:hypothetical protein
MGSDADDTREGNVRILLAIKGDVKGILSIRIMMNDYMMK